MAARFGSYSHLLYFTSLQIMIYADRSLLACLIPEAKLHFGFGEAFAGLLGSAFMGGFVVASPLAAMARTDRTKTCTIGISLLVWIVSMLGACFASHEIVLLLARVLAGVGEAGFCTLAPPIVDDTALPGRRSAFVAVYYSGMFVGLAAGFILARPFSDWITGRWVFFALALCMLPFAILMLLWGRRFRMAPNVTSLSEKPSSADGAAVTTESTSPLGSSPAPVETSVGNETLSFKNACAELCNNHGYVLLALGMSASQFSIGGLAFWAPTYLQEDLGMRKRTLSMALGVLTMTTGILGCGLGGALLDACTAWAERRRGVREGQRAVIGSQLCFALGIWIVPFSCWLAMAEDSVSFLSLLGVCQLISFLGASPMIIALMDSVPSDLRGLSIGASTLVMHLLGDVPSPAVVGHIAEDTGSLKTGIGLLGLWTVWCPICWGFASLLLSRRMALSYFVTELATPLL